MSRQEGFPSHIEYRWQEVKRQEKNKKKSKWLKKVQKVKASRQKARRIKQTQEAREATRKYALEHGISLQIAPEPSCEDFVK